MKYRSIQTRLIQFMLAVTTIPLLLSLFITFTHTRESVKEQTVNENVRLIYQGATNLMNYLRGIDRASLSVYSDPHFLRNLALDPDNYRVIAELYATLQAIQTGTQDVHQIYLHNDLTGQSTQISSNLPRREFRQAPYRTIEQFGQGNTAIEPVHQVHSYGFPPRPADILDFEVITFYRSITNVPSPDQYALMAIDVKLDSILAICDQLYAKEEEQLYLIDDNGSIIYSPDPAQRGQYLNDPELMNVIAQADKGYYDGNDAMIIYEKLDLPYAPWTLVKQIPHQTLYKNSTELTSINAIIAIFALLIVIFGTLWISIRITKPIKQLTSYMNQVKTGRLDVNIDVTSPDEIGVLSRRFRNMMDTINNLILREYRLEIANKTNQLKALQAQIDPHFLYNSLQSIGTLALQHNVPRIYSLLSSLANIMRYNMRNSEAKVTLQDEINHVRLYLELQKQRFRDQLEVIWELDPESLTAPVPKMILQPIVENYFKHGMNTHAGVGLVSISSRISEDSRLIVVIENNGSSIDEEELALIRSKLAAAYDHYDRNDNGNDSIGLLNVLMRLNLYTNNNAELIIENALPHGVIVTLNINAWESEQ
ncbi:putative sensor with HAMP domain protein [Paenibacillus vortex V453]|jgi:two-component system sensor histidine kinase YesM|uniref:Histidine kinase n=2 Tax=Paenibacillus TaxID=44249 RepID=A0A163JTY9_9BACL|nr:MULTISPECIES: sensor histidine kinase [Paenibacillus]ANA80783.1 histidine kinase [Paenibacillus glucanolyticus]AVV55145.1 HAMP domain-containing protein [Paenibacillus glucanolyticus]EFU42740.1 putative sensor with HAMP domain protein [Paenibacillus vortex V453]ETT31072.1 putative sensor with HAMP domain-containing protein [Paenibacillus sp. FSL R5-808]KZS46803.1 histidine kinase [Paenibacillus glucanolyticus]